MAVCGKGGGRLILFIAVLWRFCVLNWKSSTQYRTDYWAQTLSFFIVLGSTAAFWHGLLSHAGWTIEGWSLNSLVTLAIFGACSLTIFDLSLGFLSIPTKTVDGSLDKYLVRPGHPLLSLMGEGAQVDEAVRGILMLAVMLLAARSILDVRIAWHQVAMAIALQAGGIIVLCGLRLLMSMMAFWMGDTRALDSLVSIDNFQVERFPTDLFLPWLQVIATFVVPVGYLATYPTQVLYGFGQFWPLMARVLLVLGVLALVLTGLWKAALLLVRPIHYPSYAISLAAGRISLHLLLGIPLVIVLVTVFESVPGILRLSSFLVSSVVGLLVSAQIGLILGLLSFWTGKIFGIRDVIYSSSFLLSGALLPLQYLPHWLRQVTLFLPFRQIYDAPIQVFMGTSPAGVIGQQLAWLAALLAGSHLIWVRGMRLFECQGG